MNCDSVESTRFISRLVIDALRCESTTSVILYGKTNGVEYVDTVYEANDKPMSYVFGPR
jgi:hypothetical protein